MVETRGLLVSSENVIIMVSPSVTPGVTPPASTNSIVGPCFSPKFPVSNGDSSVEAKDDGSSASVSCTTSSFTVTVKSPMVGQSRVTSGSHSPASTIVITRVASSTKTPV